MFRNLHALIISFIDRHPGFKRLYLGIAIVCSNHRIKPRLSAPAERVEKGWREQSEKTPHRDPALYLKHDESIDLLFKDVLPILKKDAAILEIGCNAGRNLNYLHQKSYQNLHGIVGPQFGLQRERDTKISVTIFVKFSRLGQLYTFFEIFKGLKYMIGLLSTVGGAGLYSIGQKVAVMKLRVITTENFLLVKKMIPLKRATAQDSL